MTVYVISDEIGMRLPRESIPPLDPDQAFAGPQDDNVPDAQTLADSKLTVVVGPLAAADTAHQLGGTLLLALEKGATVLYLYRVRPEDPDISVLGRLAGAKRTASPTSYRVEPKHPGFRDYLTVFSRSATAFQDLPDDSEIIATVPSGGGQPTAFVTKIGRGALYVIPYHRLEAVPSFLPQLFRAVMTHREGGGEIAPPDFFDSLALPGEADLREKINDLRSSLGTRQSELDRLVRFKDLVGFASGDAFEQLTVDALNRIFDGTPYEAEDREETFEEDFWIVKGDDDFALAEAKGINSGIARPHVNAVDDHRAAAKLPHEFPGLLVINTARMSVDLDPRREPVHPDIVRHATRQNVLILRGWDLYGLVSVALEQGDAVTPLVEALQGGGGWLEVTDGGPVHHQSST